MAQDWTKMRNNLADDPAVVYVAKTLKLDPDTVVGKLLRLWAWAGDQTTNGVVRDSCALVVDHIVRVDGFASALAEKKWLELRDDNAIVFPKWHVHNSKAAKSRAKHNRLVAQKRDRNVRRLAHTSRTNTSPEKRREEKSIGGKPPITPSARPPLAGCARFDEFWNRWPAGGRKAARKQCVTRWRTGNLDNIADDVLAGLSRWLASAEWAKDDGEFIPAPLVWLNQARWEAMPEPARRQQTAAEIAAECHAYANGSKPR